MCVDVSLPLLTGAIVPISIPTVCCLSLVSRAVSKLLSSKSSLQAALSSASAHIEELTLTLQSRERELDNNARHADTEKRVLVEKIRSLETHGGEVTSRSAELEAEVTTLRAALEDAKSEKEKLAREYDILQLRKATQEQDVRAMM